MRDIINLRALNCKKPHVTPPSKEWPNADLSEWRLIGPAFAAFIVLLSKSYRISRANIKVWLADFLGFEISRGTVDRLIREAGRSAELVEPKLLEDIENAALVCADETSWKIFGVLYWLWVLRATYTVLFFVSKRSREALAAMLFTGKFKGVLMTDGYSAYRSYENRLRCWAHLIRKMRGIKESCDLEVAKIGAVMLDFFEDLIKAIYAAREKNTSSIEAEYTEKITNFKTLCLRHRDAPHKKLRALSRELLNDWDTIFKPVQNTSFLITNNDAESSLRPWVISRKLSYGTRTLEGTRAFSILASVIATCRLRKANIWKYLTEVIASARKGLSPPPLPAIPSLEAVGV